GTYPVLRPADDGFETVEEPALNALNARLRDDYLREVEGGFKRWNKVISKTGVDFELAVPHQAFNRRVGHFHEMHVTPQGEILTADTWQARKHEWLPSDGDLQFISSLMKPVTEPGRYAGWIAEPKVKVDSKPGEFEFVRLAS
ncbi:MAG: hypothetical protein WAL83_08015, partial [Arenicellales bacterium]